MKITFCRLSSALITLLFLISMNSFAKAPPLGDGLEDMVAKVTPAVVNITAELKPQGLLMPQNKPGENVPPQLGKAISIGAGVIVDAKNGYILTNAHVIADAQSVTVTLSNNRHYKAKIIGIDKPSDIAVLQIKAKNLTEVTIADSNLLKVAQTVVTIGNPFNLNQSVSSGIISGLRRSILGIENYENFIQIDAAINRGNSGGALVNKDGQLVGINTAIVSPTIGSGVGFAIPSNMAKSVMAQLIEFGNVKRGALGVGAQDITPELAAAFNLSIEKGAVITQVLPGSPAEKAGANVGDVVLSINGSDIENANDVVNAIAFLRVDSKASLLVLRNNKKITLSTIVTDPEKRKQANAAKDPFFFGTTLKNFTITSPVHGDVKGVVVVDLDADSSAAIADLHPWDIIVSANQQKITSIDELRKIASKANQTLLLNVLRGPGAVYVLINKES